MSMFRRRNESDSTLTSVPAPMDRVTTVLGPETIIKGRLTGSGGVRIEGSFEGEISLQGLLVVGENGKVTCESIVATIVVIAGAVKGNISAEKIEIRSTGRVWGDVVTTAFATQEGAFLRGQVQMEEQVELDFAGEDDEPWVEVDEVEQLLIEETEVPTVEGTAEKPEAEEREAPDTGEPRTGDGDGGGRAEAGESDENEIADQVPKTAKRKRKTY
jgi:cytoskeletal protein CcmA (bactofilin family)